MLDILDKQDFDDEDTIEEFPVIALTFNTNAWSQIKHKFRKPDLLIEQFTLNGLPCYVVEKQINSSIGWKVESVLNSYLKLMEDPSFHGDEDIAMQIIGGTLDI